MGARVVGLGQRYAGDDGVGTAVLDALRGVRLPAGVELVRLRDASELVAIAMTHLPLIVVDAVVGAGTPGQVRVLAGRDLETAPPCALSTHGVGVLQALEVARSLRPEETPPEVLFVTVTIDAPRSHQEGLCPAVAAAVPVARDVVARELARLTAGACSTP